MRRSIARQAFGFILSVIVSLSTVMSNGSLTVYAVEEQEEESLVTEAEDINETTDVAYSDEDETTSFEENDVCTEEVRTIVESEEATDENEVELEAISGKCGDNLTYELTGSADRWLLTISGTGAMYDYDSNSQPWKEVRYSIKNVVLPAGITYIGAYAFEWSSISSITIPEGVTEIGKYAFCNCESLTTVKIADSVVTIGEGAFEDCFELKNLTMGKGVVTIGPFAFSEDEKITSIVLPDSLKTIGAEAFWCTKALTSIKLPAGLEYIGDTAFNSGGLKNIIIPKSVKYIGNNAFSYIENLETVTFEEGIEIDELQGSTFAGCKKLRSVNIPSGVKKIGYACFSECKALSSIELPQGLESIYGLAFCDTGIRSFTLPDSVSFLGANALNSQWDDYYESERKVTIIYDENSKWINKAGEEVNPKTHYCYNGDLFKDQTVDSLKTGICGENLQWILSANSTGYRLTISGDGTRIYDYITGSDAAGPWHNVLEYDKKITELVFETPNLQYIGTGAFSGLSIKNFTIPSTVTEIGNNAFEYCWDLETIVIPDSVRRIGKRAFTPAYKVTSLDLGNGVEFIDDGAFLGVGMDTTIERLVIPASVKSLCNTRTGLFEAGAFASSGIKELVFAEENGKTNLKFIPHCCFRTSDKLQKITFANGIEEIGMFAFENDKALEEVIMPGTLKKIDYAAFRACAGINHIVLNDGLEEIGQEAFYKYGYKGTEPVYKALQPVIIPDSVSIIHWEAFTFNVADIKAGNTFRDNGSTWYTVNNDVHSINEYYSYGDIATIPNCDVFRNTSDMKVYKDTNATPGAVKYSVSANCDEHAYIGTAANPTTKTLNANIPANKAYVFYTAADEGYEVYEVSYSINGTDKGKLTGVSGKYTIPAASVAGNIVITVKTGTARYNITSAGTGYLIGTEPEPEAVKLNERGNKDNAFAFYVKEIPGYLLESVKYKVGNKDAVTLTADAMDNTKYVIPAGAITDTTVITITTTKATLITDTKAVVIKPINSTVVWNGGETKNNVAIETINGTPLVENKDYLAIYSNFDKPGTATITIIGIGIYHGSKDLKYTIKKPDFKTDIVRTEEEALANNKLYVGLSKESYEYDGTAHKPEVTVKYVNANGQLDTLIMGKDYTVKYKLNVNSSAGITDVKKLPSVTITGKGIYSGSGTVNFNITPIDISEAANGVKVVAPSVQYKEGKPATTKPIVSISINGVNNTLKEGRDYKKLTAESFTNNTGGSKTGTVTIVGNGNYCGTISADYSIATDNIAKVAKVSIPAEYTGKTPVVYMGKEIRPVPSVILADESGLTYGVDYTVEYINCNKAGKGTVRVRGIGKYYGMKDISFKIAPRKISGKDGETTIRDGLNVTLDGVIANGKNSYEFTGYALTPVVSIADTYADGTEHSPYTLISGKDYTVKYSNNINATTETKKASAVVTFKGDYSGKMIINYNITSWSIEDAVISVADAPYNNGKAVKTTVSVSHNGVAINPKAIKVIYDSQNVKTTIGADSSRDLVVTISGAKGKNDKNITLPAGKDGVKKTFKIMKGDISTATCVKIPAQVYKGKKITPKVTVKYLGKALKVGTDIKVTYIDNNKKGIATVLIEAGENSNFVGSMEVQFIIK